MRDLKPQGIPIKIGTDDYGLRFTLNVIDDIQHHFNRSIAELPKILNEPIENYANMRYILTLLVNEDIDCICDETGEKKPYIDERYLGRHIFDYNAIGSIGDIIYTAFIQHMPKRNEDAPDPNPKSE